MPRGPLTVGGPLVAAGAWSPGHKGLVVATALVLTAFLIAYVDWENWQGFRPPKKAEYEIFLFPCEVWAVAAPPRVSRIEPRSVCLFFWC